jgi:hypothetical protein
MVIFCATGEKPTGSHMTRLHTCPHCGRQVRGPGFVTHERACRLRAGRPTPCRFGCRDGYIIDLLGRRPCPQHPPQDLAETE